MRELRIWVKSMTNKNFKSNVPNIKTLAVNDTTDLNNVKSSLLLESGTASTKKNFSIKSNVPSIKTVATPLNNEVAIVPKVITNGWIRSISRSIITVEAVTGTIVKIQHLGLSAIVLLDDVQLFTVDGTYNTWKINLNYDDQIYTNLSNFFIEVRWAGFENKSRAYTGSISSQRNALTAESERAVYLSLDREFPTQYTVELSVYGIANTNENSMFSLLGVATSLISNFKDLEGGDIFTVTSGELEDSSFTAQNQGISGTNFSYEIRYTLGLGYSIQNRTLDIVGSSNAPNILSTSIMSINDLDTVNKITYPIKDGETLGEVFFEAGNLQFRVNSDASITLSNNLPGVNYKNSEVLPNILFADEKIFNDLILLKDNFNIEEHSVRFIFVSDRTPQQILALTNVIVKEISFAVGTDITAAGTPKVDQVIHETSELGMFELAFEPPVDNTTAPIISTKMEPILGSRLDNGLFMTLIDVESSTTYLSDPLIFANYDVLGSPRTTVMFFNDGIQNRDGDISNKQITFGQFESATKAPFVILDASGNGTIRLKIPNLVENSTLRFNIKSFTYASIDPTNPITNEDTKFVALLSDNFSKNLSVNWDFKDKTYGVVDDRYSTFYADLAENAVSHLCDQMSVPTISSLDSATDFKTFEISKDIQLDVSLINNKVKKVDLVSKGKRTTIQEDKLLISEVNTQSEDSTNFEISTGSSVPGEGGYLQSSKIIRDRNVGSTFTSSHSGMFYNPERVSHIINDSPSISMNTSTNEFIINFDANSESIGIARIDGNNSFFIENQVLGSVTDADSTVSTVMERDYTESNNPSTGNVCILKFTSLDTNGDVIPFDPNYIAQYKIIFDSLYPHEEAQPNTFALVEIATVDMSVTADQSSPPVISFSDSIGSNMVLGVASAVSLYENSVVADEINDHYNLDVTLTGTAITLGEFAYYLIIPESITSDIAFKPRETVSMLNSADYTSPNFITYKFTFKNETHFSKFTIKKLIPEANVTSDNHVLAIVEGAISNNGDPNQTVAIGDIIITEDGWRVGSNRTTGGFFFGHTHAENPNDLRQIETTSSIITQSEEVQIKDFQRGYLHGQYGSLNPSGVAYVGDLLIFDDMGYEHVIYKNTFQTLLSTLSQRFKIGIGLVGTVTNLDILTLVVTNLLIAGVTTAFIIFAMPRIIDFGRSGLSEIARYLRKEEDEVAAAAEGEIILEKSSTGIDNQEGYHIVAMPVTDAFNSASCSIITVSQIKLEYTRSTDGSANTIIINSENQFTTGGELTLTYNNTSLNNVAYTFSGGVAVPNADFSASSSLVGLSFTIDGLTDNTETPTNKPITFARMDCVTAFNTASTDDLASAGCMGGLFGVPNVTGLQSQTIIESRNGEFSMLLSNEFNTATFVINIYEVIALNEVENSQGRVLSMNAFNGASTISVGLSRTPTTLAFVLHESIFDSYNTDALLNTILVDKVSDALIMGSDTYDFDLLPVKVNQQKLIQKTFGRATAEELESVKINTNNKDSKK